MEKKTYIEMSASKGSAARGANGIGGDSPSGIVIIFTLACDLECRSLVFSACAKVGGRKKAGFRS